MKTSSGDKQKVRKSVQENLNIYLWSILEVIRYLSQMGCIDVLPVKIQINTYGDTYACWCGK